MGGSLGLRGEYGWAEGAGVVVEAVASGDAAGLVEAVRGLAAVSVCYA